MKPTIDTVLIFPATHFICPGMPLKFPKTSIGTPAVLASFV